MFLHKKIKRIKSKLPSDIQRWNLSWGHDLKIFKTFGQNRNVYVYQIKTEVGNLKKRTKKTKGDEDEKGEKGEKTAVSTDPIQRDILNIKNLEDENSGTTSIGRALEAIYTKLTELELKNIHLEANMKRDIMDMVQKEIKESKKVIKKEVENDVQVAMECYKENIDKLNCELQQQKMKIHLLNEVLQQNCEILEDISKKLDTNELNTARKTGVLTGVIFSEKKKDRQEELQNFFEETMGKAVTVEDSYFLGYRNPRPVVIIFNTAAEKQEIFKNKSRLQNFESRNGKPIYLNDYLPAGLNEKRKRERSIVAEVKKKSDGKRTAEYTEHGLKIGNEIYKRKVDPPTSSDVLNLTTEQLNDTLACESVRGPAISVEDSVFQAFATDAQDYPKVREAYLKVKIMNAKAKHIAAAWYLPGQDTYHKQDSTDDDDHGAGKIILKMMQENNIDNKAVYVVRTTGKKKLGTNRFRGYEKAIQELFKQSSYNAITRKHQEIQPSSVQLNERVTNTKGNEKLEDKLKYSGVLKAATRGKEKSSTKGATNGKTK